MSVDWWDSATRNERRGFVFAMRASGLTLRAVGALAGRGAERIRCIEASAERRIRMIADEVFPLPANAPPWARAGGGTAPSETKGKP